MHDSPADLGDFTGLGLDNFATSLDWGSWDLPKERPARKKRELKVYTLEIRMDPFVFKRYPRPFACGLDDGESFIATWGPDCVEGMMARLSVMPRGLIYSHQGGRLHFYFMQQWIQAQKMLIIDGRIVKAHCPSLDRDPHELRDSWAIIPVDIKPPYGIDPAWLERGIRGHHKQKILAHLEADCRYQHSLVKTFREMFGDRLTVGAAAMNEFQACHPFERLGPRADELVRANYYYGGRTQYFERRIVKPAAGQMFRMYDVNGMYPYVMKAFRHPTEAPSGIDRVVRKSTVFVELEGRQTGPYAAFLSKEAGGGPLRNDVEDGTFFVTIHEFNAAEELGIFKVRKIIQTLNYVGQSTFDGFVDKFAKQRADYLAAGDQVRADFTKLVHNSAYGKLAQDWRKFRESILVDSTIDLSPQGWRPAEILEAGQAADRRFCIWERKPTDANGNPVVGRFYNTGTAASITGAGRSLALRGLYQARRPIYIDTDSILCEELPGARIDPRELGAWKLEGECTEAAIANRKTYALFGPHCWKCGGARAERRPRRAGPCDDLFHDTGCVKMAASGARPDPSIIVKACLGGSVVWENPVPDLKFGGEALFRSRTIKLAN